MKVPVWEYCELEGSASFSYPLSPALANASSFKAGMALGQECQVQGVVKTLTFPVKNPSQMQMEVAAEAKGVVLSGKFPLTLPLLQMSCVVKGWENLSFVLNGDPIKGSMRAAYRSQEGQLQLTAPLFFGVSSRARTATDLGA